MVDRGVALSAGGRFGDCADYGSKRGVCESTGQENPRSSRVSVRPRVGKHQGRAAGNRARYRNRT